MLMIYQSNKCVNNIIRVSIVLFVLIPFFMGIESCGGSKYGKISEYKLDYNIQTFEERLSKLEEAQFIEVECSPYKECEYNIYNDFHINLKSKLDGRPDTSFVLKPLSPIDDSYGCEVALISGKLEKNSVKKQSGSMTKLEKRNLEKAFKKTILPLLKQ